MSKTLFLKLLAEFNGLLTKQQIKTLRGQALSGNIQGALKGLERIVG